ncbi:mycofactocin system FadH/OYE family oxidoreductase 2 [Pseudonocardia asaccharolytica]|uniref:Oxidoreductase n=1 Tax=Pseudonocardia asaccharolytica DSM 44247 = NBRC 16224 TaxID=1123024 RepID=A0A511CXR0_9PSEU|nr:mycofactocin system FadH/OYE family oxidoreductase 2 [Pseudonocardia asaccharolytica]GEL17043.1 oxidoreductase [Pseudonocardia asaccharolytica DSM 44247 = NBRC 16224]
MKLGPLTLRNRIVFAAHLTGYATEGRPSAQHVAYYAARAAGGAGLIITEEHSTHPTDRPYEKLIHGFDPAVIPGYRRITEAVHAHGVPILAQLNHNGGQSSGMYSRQPVWAPSPVPDPMFREVPKAVTAAEIRQIVAGYGRVAGHCVAGGFDGVELQCSHASIIRGFLSPATNRRTDCYGGSPTRRARLLLEIVDVVRDAIGPERVLGVRVCGDELIEGGIELDEAVALARLLEAHGGIDYLNTSIGVATASLYMIEASMHVPKGYALHIPSAIRRAVRLPVVGIGRFTTPAQAERALAEGHCDLVGVVRGQIADPEFTAKGRTGTDVRVCVGCNQECVGRVGLNRRLGCAVNPRAGREAIPVPAPTVRGRRVLVVGGGPAGLQAAVSAARRGHRVVLCERAAEPGGQVRVAAAAPGRGELLGVVTSLLTECSRLGVGIRAGAEVDAGYVRDQQPDVVVLATGARPAAPDWAAGLDRVVDVHAVLGGWAAPSGSVLVYDELGFHQATSVAELLAARGAAVEIATPGMVVGQDLGLTLDMELFHVRAHSAGITLSPDRVVLGAAPRSGGGVVLRVLHHPTGTIREEVRDWVVCAVPPEPEDTLWHALRDSGFAVYRVGDCLAPRRMHAAVAEGHRVAESL